MTLGILEDYIQSFDIACLSETKTADVPYEIRGFEAFHKKKSGHKYGGIHGLCVLVRNNFVSFVEVLELSSESVLWLKVSKGLAGEDFILGAVYVPHEGSVHYNDDVFDNIAQDVSNINNEYNVPIILIGDFNSRTGLMDDSVVCDDIVADICGFDTDYGFKEVMPDTFTNERYNRDKKVNNNGKHLIEFCKCFDLKVVNGRCGADRGIGNFTCHSANGQSTVDYVIASSSLLGIICDFYVDEFDRCLSDIHSPVCVTLSCSCRSGGKVETQNRTASEREAVVVSSHSNPETDTELIESVKTRWDINLADSYKGSFSSEDMCRLEARLIVMEDETVSQENMDIVCDMVNDIFIRPAVDLGMTKNRRYRPRVLKHARYVPDKPWFNGACRQMRADYMSKKNKLKRTKSASARGEFTSKAKEYRTLIKKTSRAYYKGKHKLLRKMKSSNPKAYWNILNEGSRDKSKMGNIATDIFFEHFKTLSQKESNDPNDQAIGACDDFDPRTIKHSINEEINRPFTRDEVLNVVKHLKSNKACGIDNVVNEFIKNAPSKMIDIMTNLFNVVLKSGVVPSNWCLGVIKPMYKQKGAREDPDNYRGITLLSCVGKVFTAMLNDRLASYVSAVGILGDEQAGFRPGFSTIDQMFVLQAIIEIYLHKRKRLYCAFVDYHKAFDLVDRSSLWLKLISCGINGRLITVIYNLYDQAKSCVKMPNGSMSDQFMCNIGVRQGENLSPLLFAIYLNDFELFISQKYKGLSMVSTELNVNLSDEDVEVFVRLYALLYADDTVIMAENEHDLQSALNATYDYCKQWQLTVNTAKTKIVVFSRGKIRNKPFILFGESLLEVVFEYSYLGIVFNYDNSFKKAICKQVNQAKRAMYAMLSKCKRLVLPVDMQCELFKQLIVPILLYGCEMWGFEKIDQIEVFFRKFLKDLLHVKKGTPNCMVYGETGQNKLAYTVDGRIMNYWCRLVSGNCHKLSFIMYKLLRVLTEKGDLESKWIVNTRELLNKCGFSNLWNIQDGHDINPTWFKQAIKLRLSDIGLQEWHEEVWNHDRCHVYRIIKDKLCFESYINTLNFKERVALTKFRCRSSTLPVCKYVNDYGDNICNLCEANEVGDEFHYLFVCNAFHEERKFFIPKYYSQHPNIIKLRQLFAVKDRKTLVKLCLFVKIIAEAFM